VLRVDGDEVELRGLTAGWSKRCGGSTVRRGRPTQRSFPASSSLWSDTTGPVRP